MNAADYKCPSCSAVLKYNPESNSWKCEYCGSEYRLEDLERNEKKFEDLSIKETMDVDEYSCPNCGAQIVTDENTAATFCVYCGNTAIIKNRLTGMLKPTSVIPFKTTKEKAIETFLNFKKGKPFAPKEFGKKEQIEKITGVYVPFWLYDCLANGYFNGTGATVRTWTTGNYRYTKTDTYSIVREGNATFEKIPVDGSSKFDDDTMDSIEPFDYNGMVDFTPAYLSGFLAEKYDVDDKEAYKRAEYRIDNAMKSYISSTVSGYTSVTYSTQNINKDIKNIKYTLFPVWMLNIKYKDKMHLFAMNGQTGKFVGNIPIDWGKFWLTFFGIFGGSFGIMALILYIISLS